MRTGHLSRVGASVLLDIETAWQWLQAAVYDTNRQDGWTVAQLKLFHCDTTHRMHTATFMRQLWAHCSHIRASVIKEYKLTMAKRCDALSLRR